MVVASLHAATVAHALVEWVALASVSTVKMVCVLVHGSVLPSVGWWRVVLLEVCLCSIVDCGSCGAS